MPMVISAELVQQSLLLGLVVLPLIGHPASKIFPKIFSPKECCWIRGKRSDVVWRDFPAFCPVIIDKTAYSYVYGLKKKPPIIAKPPTFSPNVSLFVTS